MRESQFIQQNQAKWEEFERLFDPKTKIGKGKGPVAGAANGSGAGAAGSSGAGTADGGSAGATDNRRAGADGSPGAGASGGKADPGRLRRLYVEITEDLAYARTFYPNRSVRVYLNHLAQRVVQRIHGARSRSWSWRQSGFRHFWVEDLPRVLYDSRMDILLALVVFLVSVGIGVLSSSQDNSFAQLILGQQYIDMTEANIEKGDPMYVYKDSEPFPMFLRIALNNLFVDAITFAAGAVFAIGAMFVLLVNGIMVGAFQYFFVEFGLFRESFLTIWQHGTLEMSAAVLAGAAGMAMGRGMVFPGTFSRMQAFRLSARRAVKIMALVVPMTLIAAVIESWVTRMTELPDLLRAASIAVSLFLVIGYAWWYPRMRARRGWAKSEKDPRLPAPRPQDLRLDSTRSAGEIFILAFAVYRRFLPFWLPRLLLACGLLAIGAGLASDWLIESRLWFYRMPFAGSAADLLLQMPRYLELTAQFGNSYAAGFLLPFQTLGCYAALWVTLRAYAGLPHAFAGQAQPGTGVPKPETVLTQPGSGASSTATVAPRQRLFRHATVLVLTLVLCSLLFLAKPWGKLCFAFFLPIWAMAAAAIWFESAGMVQGLRRAFGLAGGSSGTLLGAYLATALMGLIGVWLIHSPLMGLFWQILETNFLLDESAAMAFRVGAIVFTAFAAFFTLLPLSIAALVGVFFHAREALEAKGLEARWSAFGERQNRWV